VLAGCGTFDNGEPQPVEPKLPQAAARQLIAQTRAVETAYARDDGCAAGAALASLHATSIRLVNAGRVPAAFQEELQAAVGDLASRPTPACAPPPAQVGAGDDNVGSGDDKGDRGHGHKNGHKGKHGN
jgi:hypothetical protein